MLIVGIAVEIWIQKRCIRGCTNSRSLSVDGYSSAASEVVLIVEVSLLFRSGASKNVLKEGISVEIWIHRIPRL